MFARIALAATLLTLAFLAGIGWQTGLFEPAPATAQESVKQDAPPSPKKEPLVKEQVSQPSPAPQQFQDPSTRPHGATEPIVMARCKVDLIAKEDVPSQREGV